jgi:hypothetical protein
VSRQVEPCFFSGVRGNKTCVLFRMSILSLIPNNSIFITYTSYLNIYNSYELYPKGRGFDSHRGQANFSVCPVWMHTQSNITNIIRVVNI